MSSGVKFVAALGKVIGQMRRHRKMSQAEAAEKAGLHPMALSKIERGVHTAIGCQTLLRIGDALGVDGFALYARAELQSTRVHEKERRP